MKEAASGHCWFDLSAFLVELINEIVYL